MDGKLTNFKVKEAGGLVFEAAASKCKDLKKGGGGGGVGRKGGARKSTPKPAEELTILHVTREDLGFSGCCGCST